MKSPLIPLSFILGAFTILAITGKSDEQQAHQYHCEMVQLWEHDALHGVVPEQRRGWPNYNNTECGELP